MKPTAARASKLLAERALQNQEALFVQVEKLETHHQNQKGLRWALDIDDDVVSDQARRVEFRTWINKLVLPCVAGG